VRSLRRELGLRVDCDPVFKDKFSPMLVLALFSSCLGAAQPDWPRHTLQPGFVFYDRRNPHEDDCPELAHFLVAGDAPIVFTLGSTAVHNPGDFYEVSITAARQLGRRAVLIGAKATSEPASTDILAVPYAPYSQIFFGAAVIVHQGGSGTTGQALRAGRPQLIVPYGWDQPDNGARVERLGVGLCLERSGYSVQSAVEKLTQLIENRRFAVRAAQAGTEIREEDSLRIACDAVDALLIR
jgi:rhamnosyltransferase subunit B